MSKISRYQLNRTKYLQEPELLELKRILKKFESTDPRNTALIELALCTGGRAQELLNIELTDLNTHDQSVFIRGIKGSMDREIPIPQALFRRLLNLKPSNPGPFSAQGKHRLFEIEYHRLRQIWTDYRPVPKKFHCLRHTFAIQLYQKTKDLRLLQVALGHRNISNTMIYADYLYSLNELKRLIL